MPASAALVSDAAPHERTFEGYLNILTKIIEQLGPQELLKTQVHSSSRHGR